jgi:predicted dehydrogenase
MVEKPMALNDAECARLTSAARTAAGRATISFNLRHHRLVRQARAIVASGRLGRIKAVHSAYTHDRTGVDAPDWHREIRLGGGVIANEAVHHFDLWRYLLGCEVNEVACWSRPSAVYEDETATVAASLSDGVRASGIFTLGSSPTSEVDIYGDAGRLHLDCYRFDGLALYDHATYPGDLGDRGRRALGAIRLLAEGLPALRRGGDFQDAFRGMWQHFVDCIQQGRDPLASLEDGARAVAVATACLQSAAEGGRPVALPAAV